MIFEKEDRLVIEGPMTIETTTALLEAGTPFFAAADRTLDLAAVTTVDSAALAVVLGFLRSAQTAGHSITLINPPQAFSSFAALYGVDELLSKATNSNESNEAAAQP